MLVVLLETIAARQDLMVACYAHIPDHVESVGLCAASEHRVLRAREGEAPSNRRRLMQCGEFCSGWGDRTFCMEYGCDSNTVGEFCETQPATADRQEIVGLVDKAKAHFKEHAKMIGAPECIEMMEKLECMCVDQNSFH